ncbi:hypothetical protein AHiyo8_27010 [Arthrobacter sp. Hiyo8]|nr:hypothetical protein AHiyo8_27010 [Arthrobacter sp. Hiyo8]
MSSHAAVIPTTGTNNVKGTTAELGYRLSSRFQMP